MSRIDELDRLNDVAPRYAAFSDALLEAYPALAKVVRAAEARIAAEDKWMEQAMGNMPESMPALQAYKDELMLRRRFANAADDAERTAVREFEEGR